ncbi:hypothetical protein CBL_11045 [Carabus blaptoides fortunei]
MSLVRTRDAYQLKILRHVDQGLLSNANTPPTISSTRASVQGCSRTTFLKLLGDNRNIPPCPRCLSQTLSVTALQEAKDKEKYLDRTVISVTMKIMLWQMMFGRKMRQKKDRGYEVEGKNYLMQSETN